MCDVYAAVLVPAGRGWDIFVDRKGFGHGKSILLLDLEYVELEDFRSLDRRRGLTGPGRRLVLPATLSMYFFVVPGSLFQDVCRERDLHCEMKRLYLAKYLAIKASRA